MLKETKRHVDCNLCFQGCLLYASGAQFSGEVYFSAFYFQDTARSTSLVFFSVTFFVSLFSPYYWIIKGITVHLVDCSTLPKVVDKLFDVEVSMFGPWYQTLGLRWKTSLGC